MNLDPVVWLEKFFLLESTQKAIRLEDWQKAFLHSLLDDSSISLAVLSATKKTGKSTLAAGVALYVLFCWKAPVEVLLVANAKEQAQTLAFQTLSYCCKNQPDLAKSCTVYRDKIVTKSGAVCRVLPTKAKTVAGASPSLVVYDEAWGLTSEDEEIWSELTSIPTKRSLTLVCSYAGLEGQSPLLRRLYDLGQSEDKPEDMLFMWSTNPKLSSWVTDTYLFSQRKKLLPHQFSRLFENAWTSASGAFITKEDWDNCLWDYEIEPQDRIFLGLDLGVKKDASCLVGVAQLDDMTLLAHFKAWEPGHGEEVNLESIYEYLLEMSKQKPIAGLWYDPRYATSIVQRLEAKGAMRCHEVSPMPSSVSRCYEHLYQVCKGGRFKRRKEPTLTKHILNCVGRDTGQGIMLERRGRAASQKIDGAVALALACWGARPRPGIEILYERIDINPLLVQQKSPLAGGRIINPCARKGLLRQKRKGPAVDWAGALREVTRQRPLE